MATTTSSNQQSGPTGSTSLGIPIQMPTDRAVSPQQRPLSTASFRRHHGHGHGQSTSSIPSVFVTADGSLKSDENEKKGPTTERKPGLLGAKRPNRSGLGDSGSTTSVNKLPGRNSQSAAQVVLLKRKRNQEPLDGLLLEMGSRYPSEHNLSRGGAGGEEPEEEEEAIEEKDVKREGSVRARKRKRIASARGFFQLAETVEKAKWDDEAWRRDFNERVITKSKEGKKALAAAAGVEVALDSPVIEKTQVAATTSSSSVGQGMLSPTRDTSISASAKPPRKYTVVLQTRPPTSDTRAKETVLPTKGAPKTADDPVPPIGGKVDETGKTKETPVEPKAGSVDPKGAVDGGGGGGSEGKVLYFDAVPYGSSEEDSSDSAKREEDEIAAFLPMLQDYLKLHDLPVATNIVPDPKLQAKKPSGKTQVNPKKGGEDGLLVRKRKAEEVEDKEEEDDEDEYVYDVYFKRSHEPTSTDWNNMGNYGTLVSVPPEMREDEEDSDGGVGDESDYDIDDDSNDEGFYRNDYPDEEDDYSEEESDDFYDDRDDSEEEEDYDDERRWR
ncbi:hypothetical protein FRC19_004011 [Serendipita sp. 401]|nr:hypothetical protein FRC15_004390 [Serendipita sp. 397]KAG8811267.1 hypothetical protein FRC19_004011 [Serendipita sp. 401]KAG8843935.1 hypothetical protein FRC20_003685 [Serendipita sp. 405]KAG9040349.1 hypothetical protein FS842_003075 [Serendipita sp. 407]